MLLKLLGIGLVLCAFGLILWQGIRSVRNQDETAELPRVSLVTTTQVSFTESTTLITTTQVTEPKPTTTKKSTTEKPTETELSVSYPLELNHATAEELETLEGIGSVIAQRIVEYRAAIGGFTNRVQLLDVEGIGESKYNAIYSYLYIEGEQPLAEETEPPTETQPVQTAAPIQAQTQTPTESEPQIIDLNQADLDQLMTLPEMTEELAQSILDFRKTIGAYSNVYELLYIEGMTRSYFVEIEPYLVVQS